MSELNKTTSKRGRFILTNETIKKFIKIICLAIAFTSPVFASEPIDSYSDQFVREAPVALNLPRGEDFDPCSCVSYFKYKVGLSQSISLGNARDIFPWYLEPRDSGMVITYEGGGHVAYYEKRGDLLDLYEANYISCRVSTRTISSFDPVIRGFR